MSEHLLKAGGSAGERPVEEGVRLPHLRTWFRTRSAIVLHLSNGIMQVSSNIEKVEEGLETKVPSVYLRGFNRGPGRLTQGPT